MTLNFESEYEKELPFDAREVAEKVFTFTMDYLGCPYEAEVSLLLTDDETIHQINKEQRDIDRATDVLSFPTDLFINDLSGQVAAYFSFRQCLSLIKRSRFGCNRFGFRFSLRFRLRLCLCLGFRCFLCTASKYGTCHQYSRQNC